MCGGSGPGQAVRLLKIGLNLAGQPLRGELRLRANDGGASISEGLGVGRLVLIEGARQGHEDRRAADHGQFRHGRSAGAGDHEMGPGQPVR